MSVFFLIIFFSITSSSGNSATSVDIIDGDLRKSSNFGTNDPSPNLADDPKAEPSASSDSTRKNLNKYIIDFNADSSVYKIILPIGLILYVLSCLWFILTQDECEDNEIELKHVPAIADLEDSSYIMDSMWTSDLEMLASIDSDMLDLPSVPKPDTELDISSPPPETLPHFSKNLVVGKRMPEDGLCHVSINFGQMETLTSTFERIDEIQQDLLVAEFYASSDSCPFSPRSFTSSPTPGLCEKRCPSTFGFLKV